MSGSNQHSTHSLLPDAMGWLHRSNDSKSPSNARVYAEVILGRLSELEEQLQSAQETLRLCQPAWEAEVAMLKEQYEKSEEQRKGWQRHAGTSDLEVRNLRTNLVAVIAALDLPAIEPSLLWKDSAPAIMTQIERVVDAANDDHAKRVALQEQLEAALSLLTEITERPVYGLWSDQDLVDRVRTALNPAASSALGVTSIPESGDPDFTAGSSTSEDAPEGNDGVPGAEESSPAEKSDA